MPDYQLATRRAALRHGLDPDVFVRQIAAESGFNPRAGSPAGARGIAQFMPATAKGMGVNLNDNRASDDLDGAARLMASYVKKYGNITDALTAYNAGPGRVGRPLYGETRAYIQKILGGGRIGSPAKGAPAPAGPTTTTTPGVDNSRARGQLIAQYLQRNGGDPRDFALGIHQLRDVPAQTVSAPASKASPSSAPGAGATGHGGSKLLELFWQGNGGVNVKDGKKVPQGFVSGHQDHVHVAAGPKTVVALGQLAEKMGLHVGENEHFGGVNPVHVANSYHYKNEAIDVSGTPAQMRAYAHRVASMYGIR